MATPEAVAWGRAAGLTRGATQGLAVVYRHACLVLARRMHFGNSLTEQQARRLALGFAAKLTTGAGAGHRPRGGTETTTSPPVPKTPTGSQVLAQINLNPPAGGNARGIAEILREGGKDGLAIVATGVEPNASHDAYAVWLYDSPSDSRLLGFVNPRVGATGRLQTAGALPSDASHFTKILVTLETEATPSSPGPVVLQGTLQQGGF